MSTDTRSYPEKWEDEDYVKQISALSGNNYWSTELFEAMKLMRLEADAAKTPDELVGIQKCLKIMRALITISEKARKKIQIGEQLERLSE